MDNHRNEPTIFHITHHKTGSQWVMQLLHECAPERFIRPLLKVGHFTQKPVLPGMIYPTVYINRKDFYTVMPPWHAQHYLAFLSPRTVLRYYQNWQCFGWQRQPYKTFVVIRDLRDTLVSLYFSLKYSHPIMGDKISSKRINLGKMNPEEGMIYLIKNILWRSNRIQTSWLKEKTLLIKYEDLIADESTVFPKIIEHCEINVSGDLLQSIIQRNSFQTRSGRPKGSEDISSHYRKGIVGDWRNHFTDRVTYEFKEQFGKTLIRTGYEKDLNW